MMMFIIIDAAILRRTQFDRDCSQRLPISPAYHRPIEFAANIAVTMFHHE